MKKSFSLFFAFLIAFAASAQTDDPKTLYETAKNFMRTGDFDNAIVVLSHALEQDKDNLDTFGNYACVLIQRLPSFAGEPGNED